MERVVNLPSDSSPCRSCPRDGNCKKGTSPDAYFACIPWCAWFAEQWIVVTAKIKEAASPADKTEEAANKNNHLNSSGGEPKCQP